MADLNKEWEDATTVALRSEWEAAAPAAPPPTTKPSLARQILEGAAKQAPAGPLGMAIGAGNAAMAAGNNLIADWGYDAGGKVTDVTGSPELGFATNVAVQAVPALAGGKAAEKLFSPAMVGGAQRLMQSALKPTLADLKTGKAASAIQTMLDEGVNVTPGGVMKLKNKIAALNDEIGQLIANSPATISKSKAASELQGTLDRFGKQVNPNADTKVILNAWDEFMNHPLLSRSNDIPVQLAQEMKQTTGRLLSKKNAYGQMGTADVESQKALTRGLKEGIADAVPEVAGLNAAESKMLNALNINERRVLISANKNPLGLSMLSLNPAAWAAFMADKSEMFKSLAARMLYSGAERIPQAIAGTGIAAAQGGIIPQNQQPSLLSPYIEQR